MSGSDFNSSATLNTPLCFDKEYNVDDSDVLCVNLQTLLKSEIDPINEDAKNKNKFKTKNCIQCVNSQARQMIVKNWKKNKKWKKVDGRKEDGYVFINTQKKEKLEDSEKFGYFELGTQHIQKKIFFVLSAISQFMFKIKNVCFVELFFLNGCRGK